MKKGDRAKKYSIQETALFVKSAWIKILQRDVIDWDDNFFILGGDSILGAMVLFSVYEEFSIELSLGDLYDRPTIKELSVFLFQKQEI